MFTAENAENGETMIYAIFLPKPDLLLSPVMYSSLGIMWKVTYKSPQPPFVKGGQGGFFPLERDLRVIDLS
jgi:hypothetical protein